jgi:hypothetical protein
MSVTIAMATRGDDICADTMMFVLEALLSGEAVKIVVSEGGPAAKNQAFAFHMAYLSKTDHVYMLDSDVAPPSKTISRLVARDKPLIVSPVLMYDADKGDVHFNVSNSLEMHGRTLTRGSGVEETLLSSFGSVLIRRDVLDAFVRRNESYTSYTEAPHGQFSPPLPSGRTQVLQPEYRSANSDSIFFLKAKAFGFPLYVDWDIETATHKKRVTLTPKLLEKIVERSK